MIRISDLKLPVSAGRRELLKKAARELKVGESDILSLRIHRRSLDARKKPYLFYIYTVDVNIGKKSSKSAWSKHNKIMSTPDEKYLVPPSGSEVLNERPVVIGCGPAGLFAAYLLAQQGYRPLILERGGDVNERTLKVNRFWKENALDPETNVQFGEGGAGTY